MSNGDTVVPPTDLTTAAIQAVNLILSELGISPLDILLGLFAGKPKFADTNAVIAAYNKSAYWPLHALASDLQIAANNGAPISDSRPAIQAQFGVWKQGTVTSIQTFAGGQAGATDPGYWTIFALIEDSWKASGDGEGAVLQYVKALDALTQVLAQENGQTQQPPSVPPSPPGPTAGPCPPFQTLPDCLPQPGGVDHDLDEIGNGFAGIAYWLQVIAIYLMNIFQKGAGAGTGNGGNADPVTCTQLTGLFDKLTAAIGSISITIPPPPPIPQPLGPVDLTAIDADLKNLQTTLATFEKCVCDALNIPNTTADNLEAKWRALVQADIDAGFINATDAQILFS
jgi:hypothetical protein